MTEKTFFVNHTRKSVVPTELDAVFNISKSLRETIRRFHWSLEDHIELVSHTRGIDLTYFIVEGSPVMPCDYETRGPFGV
jgi:hypothetical protein